MYPFEVERQHGFTGTHRNAGCLYRLENVPRLQLYFVDFSFWLLEFADFVRTAGLPCLRLETCCAFPLASTTLVRVFWPTIVFLAGGGWFVAYLQLQGR